jgi:hypothetical protein
VINTPNTTETTTLSVGEEHKDQFNGHSLSKFDYDLYKEEDDVAEKVIRVKRITLPNKGERWKVFCDNKIVFVIEGNKLSKKEKQFLQTIQGVNFILAFAKAGFTSISKLRAEIKDKLERAAAKTMPVKIGRKRGRPRKNP